ncbi:MAG: hypothetical protein AB7L65_06235 [Hyphomonadaceae bacterium]
MSVDQLLLDLGGPVDFYDVLANLHAHGLITFHADSDALTLTARGWAQDFTPSGRSHKGHLPDQRRDRL